MRNAIISWLLALALLGCSPTPSIEDAGSDTGTLEDAGEEVDAPMTTDAGAPGDTWSSFAEAFMQTYCVRCHMSSPRDFRLLADVRANTVRARCGVSASSLSDCGSGPPPRQFPVGSGPFPSDDERTRFVAWLDAGAPE